MENIKQAIKIIENADRSIANIEKFSSYYFYINTLKKKITELEEKIRDRGFELMGDLDIKKITLNEYEIIKIEPTETESYSASSVIEALGMDRAIAFLKIDSKINTYFKKASAVGAITTEEIEKCRIGLKKKPKIGYLKLQKKKIDK
jgi:hypothetical protein